METVDFFISYARSDRRWAEWIAWTLEEAGYSVIIQTWDFRPGTNFVIEMDRAIRGARRMIAVLSADYLNAAYTQSEWAAAFAQNPTGAVGPILPIRVADCQPKGLLGSIVYVDLVGLPEPEARAALMASINQGRDTPAHAPQYPANIQHTSPAQPRFPKDVEQIRVFFSYAHADEQLRRQLESHLSLLRRQGTIAGWHDRMISAGSDWEQEISSQLASSQIVLLLVSSDFIASDYCYGIELKQAMERHERGEAKVIPVILRATDWRSGPFGKLQALPRDGKAITSWTNLDEAFANVVEGIRLACRELKGTLATAVLNDTELRVRTAAADSIHKLVDVFKYPGVPSITFVEPDNFYLLKHSVTQPGLGVVIEGPSGIGKTTALKHAVEQLRLAGELSGCEFLSARRAEDVRRISVIEQWHRETTVLDDFHRLDESIRGHVSDYLKDLADREGPAKLIVIGIPGTGRRLIEMAFDLATRIRTFGLGKASDDLVLSMIEKGENALNVRLDRKADLVLAANGSLNIAQMLCSSVATRAGVIRTQETTKVVRCEVELAIDSVMEQLGPKFDDLVRCFAALDGPADRTCIGLLEELGQTDDGRLALIVLRDRRHDLAVGIDRFIRDDYVARLRERLPTYERSLYYDQQTQALVIDDPQLKFFLVRTPAQWLAKRSGKFRLTMKDARSRSPKERRGCRRLSLIGDEAACRRGG